MKPDDDGCVGMYADLERNIDSRRQKLTAYRLRTDVNEYEVVLRGVMRLFGEGIHESLTRTMGKFE